jgi:hypothetical protein
MLRETYRKVQLLRQEVVAAVDSGPKGSLAKVFKDTDVHVVMWDAVSLARELLPEVSLHFARLQARNEPQVHALKYVVVRTTNEVIIPTEHALDSWLMDNAGVQREMQVETAITSIRKVIDTLSPDVKKRAYRHLRLLNQELLPS